ncbi:MAG: hypothetical protein LW650_01010 [Planctomycetaceae bacterium]|jgi:hypothetical protein|nr:hypothetical protein [Phycisphaerales bacterium]MCE2652118.1 hypothetical protein [Planctomycetaceae bacterium]
MTRRLSLRVPARLALLTLLAAGASLTGGCWTPGGLAMSLDRYTYESHPMTPQTVTVVDARTEQELWSVDIPVGDKLVVEFFRDQGDGSADRPDRMVWDVWPISQNWGEPQNQINVPPASSRKLVVSVRKAPELPGQMKLPPVEPIKVEDTVLTAAAGLEVGRFYIVAARLSKVDAAKARSFLESQNISAVVVDRPTGAWVVVNDPSFNQTDFNAPGSAADRQQALQRVLEAGKAWMQADRGAPTNFSMAAWEQVVR